MSTGAEIIVDHLIDEGVPYLFGLCGHGNIGLLDAAFDRKGEIEVISCHHEQTAGFMADAYFRVSGHPVATITSCGPGSVNIQTAAACALSDSSAFRAITGNIPTEQFNRAPFQELWHHHEADFVSAMRPYVKRSFQATRPDMLPGALHHAFRAMSSGRRGPVHLDVPFNVFLEATDAPRLSTGEWRSGLAVRSAGNPEAIAKAVTLLAEAERPLLLAGYGVVQSRADAELLAVAERLNVPVVTTPQGKGAIDERSERCLGPVGRDGTYQANEAGRSCDVLLAVGTRFGDRATSGWIPGMSHSIPPTRLIHVDSDPDSLGRAYPTELGILGDAQTVLRQILAEYDPDQVVPTVREKQEAWFAQAPGPN